MVALAYLALYSGKDATTLALITVLEPYNTLQLGSEFFFCPCSFEIAFGLGCNALALFPLYSNNAGHYFWVTT